MRHHWLVDDAPEGAFVELHRREFMCVVVDERTRLCLVGGGGDQRWPVIGDDDAWPRAYQRVPRPAMAWLDPEADLRGPQPQVSRQLARYGLQPIQRRWPWHGPSFECKADVLFGVGVTNNERPL